MLLKSYRQSCDTFRRALETLQSIATQANLDGVALQSAFLAAQQIFQLQLNSIDFNDVEPAIAHAIQSLHVEINKQLRLLAVDIMFLQAARQSITAQKRQAQMGDRLRLLLRYCDALTPNLPIE